MRKGWSREEVAKEPSPVGEELATRGLLLGSINEDQISDIDDRSYTLACDKDRVPPIQSVCQDDKTATQAHVPKGKGHLTFGFSFRDNPLKEPSGKKKTLPQKSNPHPNSLCCGNCGPPSFAQSEPHQLCANSFTFGQVNDHSRVVFTLALNHPVNFSLYN